MSLITAIFAWFLGLASPILPAGSELQPCSDVDGATVCFNDDLAGPVNRPGTTGTTRATPDEDPIYNGF